MKETDEVNPQLKYPFRIELFIRMIFLWLLLWGIALLVTVPTQHDSHYENPLVSIVVGIGFFFIGLLALQSIFIIITHWEKFTFIVEKDGFHGVDGVSIIPWSEVASIEDKTIRYTRLGQRSHFLTIRVRTLNKIFKREQGNAIWLRRLGKSPDFIIVNVKRKDIQFAMRDIERMFRQEIRKHGIQIYGMIK